jgi:mediator of RNA polymerase II transcription subunit 25
MCCPTPGSVPVSQVIERQKHCILVAASNPHRLPTPIPRLPGNSPIQPSTNSDPSAIEHWWLADADAVAKAFPQVVFVLPG